MKKVQDKVWVCKCQTHDTASGAHCYDGNGHYETRWLLLEEEIKKCFSRFRISLPYSYMWEGYVDKKGYAQPLIHIKGVGDREIIVNIRWSPKKVVNKIIKQINRFRKEALTQYQEILGDSISLVGKSK